jgi:hypothetical protein
VSVSDFQIFDTAFEHWQIRLRHGSNAVDCQWRVQAGEPATRGYEFLNVVLQARDQITHILVELAVCSIYAGGQVEIEAGLPIQVTVDARASILTIELVQLFVVRDGMVSLEPLESGVAGG